MSETERTNTAWDRIEQWLEKNMPQASIASGADDSEINALQEFIGLTLPEGLRASLLRHNGMESWIGGSLSSVTQIKGTWERWAPLVDSGYVQENMPVTEENEYIQPVWWCKSWIPIQFSGSGDNIVIDLQPGPLGKLGQVLDFSHEIGARGPIFSDYSEYLLDFAVSLESGKYEVFEDIYIQEK